MKKQKIPVKEEYYLYNFCKQFTKLIVNPFNKIYSLEWDWKDYLIENYRKNWNELLQYYESDSHIIFTVIDNNDGLVNKCAKGLWKVNRVGYFIIKMP